MHMLKTGWSRWALSILTTALFACVFVVSSPQSVFATDLNCGQMKVGGGATTYDFAGCPTNANFDQNGEFNFNGVIFKAVSPGDAAPSIQGKYGSYFMADGGGNQCGSYIVTREADVRSAKSAQLLQFQSTNRCDNTANPIGTLQVSLNNGLTAAGGQSRSTVTTNVDAVCEAIDKDNKEACVNKITTATTECLKEQPDLADKEEDLINCIAQKSGYRADQLKDLLKDATEDGGPACKVGDGMGWIVCPTTNFLAKITDGAYYFLQGFLRYDVLANDTTRPQLEAQWTNIRNIANVAFIIAFMVIIYSQLTGKGIDNYGVKRLLPRLIIASILVNLSFWICVLIVDVFNILGQSLYELFIGAGKDLQKPEISQTVALVLGGATIAGLAAAGALMATLSFLYPILISALFAVIIVIIVLIARQAILTILIVIAPLAFVAYLLPNTQKWFEKWKDIFISMLLIYPMVSILFGGAQFAAGVVMLGDDGILMKIFAFGIQTVPLFIVPMVLKSTGGMLGKIGALGDRGKGLSGALGKRGQDYLQRKRQNMASKTASGANWRGKGLKAIGKFSAAAGKTAQHKDLADDKDASASTRAGRYILRKGWGGVARLGEGTQNAFGGTDYRAMNREEKNKAAEDGLGRSQADYKRDRLINDPGYAMMLAGGDKQRADMLRASANAEAQKVEESEIKGHKFELEGQSISQLEAAIAAGLQSGDMGSTRLAAAVEVLGQKAGAENATFHEAISKIGQSGQASAATRSAGRAAAATGLLSGGQAAEISSGRANRSYTKMVEGNIEGGLITGEKFMGLGGSSLRHVENTLHKPGLDTTNFREGMARIRADATTHAKLSGDHARIVDNY